MTKQVPTPPNEWLTRLLTNDEHDREFAKVLFLPYGAERWEEWTQEQYEDWQEEYNQYHEPEPPEPEQQ